MRTLILLVSLACSLPAAAEEHITSFASRIRILDSGAMLVTETIAVEVEGRQIKRGILRDFPTEYRDRAGRKVAVLFEAVSVKRDGGPERWAAERQRNGVRLRIGSPAVYLPRGPHVYEIAYRTDFQLGFFDDHDELYWNVSGNGWTFAMDEVSAEVELPSAVPAAQLKAEAYTGAFGAHGHAYVAAVRDGGASWRTTQRLSPREGLTIAFMFPKGVIAPPTLWHRLERSFGDNPGEMIGAAGLLLLVAFLLWRWMAVGRDPRSGPLFPRYEAPKGLGPGAVRYLDRKGFDDRCFAATLLGLGQRGYLQIREKGGSYRVTRTGKALDWLPGEQPVAALAPQTGSVEISPTHQPFVKAARDGLQRELTQFGERLFSRNWGSQVAGFLIGAATFALMVMNDVARPVLVVAAILIVALWAVAGKVLPAYTPEGRRMEDEVEGLRQYLGVAEGDELARMKQPPRTKEEFAKFLPYAIALDVEKTWADTFATVLGAAALAAVTAEYFSSSSGSTNSVDGLVGSLGDMGSTISAASTPPGSSSGSSDSGGGGDSGGSSGGGGGGGGGSGW